MVEPQGGVSAAAFRHGDQTITRRLRIQRHNELLYRAPALFAILAIAAEFAGSIALIAGFLSRISAFGITVVMLVASLMVHASNGFFMNWAGIKKVKDSSIPSSPSASRSL